MHLEGSCHCGKVAFSLEAYAPLPFMRCHCSICRKTQGGGGFAINLGGWKKTLKVKGEKHVQVYRARGAERGEAKKRSSLRRHFCGRCGSALWCYDPTWPDLVHPFASAIDTPLPAAPAHDDIMLAYKASWEVLPPKGKGDRRFEEYPDLSLADWHETQGWVGGQPPKRGKAKAEAKKAGRKAKSRT